MITWRPVRAVLKSRQAWLILDGALAALANVSILLAASRLLASEILATFAVLQLIMTTSQALQRAAFLAPALASQRYQGKGNIPLIWLIKVLPIVGLLSTGASLGYLLMAAPEDLSGWAAILFAQVAILALDIVRYRLLSQNRIRRAVASDSISVPVSIVALAWSLIDAEARLGLAEMLWLWGLSLIGALACALLLSGGSRSEHPPLGLKGAWLLGRWSGLDQLISASASIAPLVVTGIALQSDLAGPYRVLQAALGPLNIIAVSISTRFGMDAWRLTSMEATRALGAGVRRLTAVLVLFTAAYISIALGSVVVISELSGLDIFRVCLIVAACGLLGSLTTPLSAACAALGYQRFGVGIRFIVVVAVAAVTIIALAGGPVPWDDPIGVSALAASLVGLAGWGCAFRLAMRAERKRFGSERRRLLVEPEDTSRGEEDD